MRFYCSLDVALISWLFPCIAWATNTGDPCARVAVGAIEGHRAAVAALVGARAQASETRTGLDRIQLTLGPNGEKVWVAPEIEIVSPSRSSVFEDVYETAKRREYSDLGMSSNGLVGSIIKEMQKKGEIPSIPGVLEEFARGGMQIVYSHPAIPNRLIKAYSPEMIWQRLEMNMLGRIEQLKGEIDALPSGVVQAKKQQQLSALESEYRRIVATTPAGETVPSYVYQFVTAMIQRHVEYAKDLEAVLPRLTQKMGVPVTMVKGLESVDRNGVSVVHLLRKNQIAADGSRWIDPHEAIALLEEMALLEEKDGAMATLGALLDFDRKWKSALSEFNARIIQSGTHERMGLSLTKNNVPIGFDVGTPGSKLANVFVRVDAKGKIVEIRIIDF